MRVAGAALVLLWTLPAASATVYGGGTSLGCPTARVDALLSGGTVYGGGRCLSTLPPVPLLAATELDDDGNHVLGHGQSNSTPQWGPAQTTAQVGANVRASGTSFVALREGPSPDLEGYLSSSVNELRRRAQAAAPGIDFVGSTHGAGGQRCDQLDDAADGPFNLLLAQVADSYAQRASIGGSHRIASLDWIQGEADILASPDTASATYQACLRDAQARIEDEIQTRTGQTRAVPWFVAQVSTCADNGSFRCTIPGDQLEVVEDFPRRFYFATPTYALPFSADGVHYSADGAQRLGQLLGYVRSRVLIAGQDWTGLTPSGAASCSGSTVVIPWHSPCQQVGNCSGAALVFDTGLTCPMMGSGDTVCREGFEFFDPNTVPRHVTGVSISGQNVVLTLNGTCQAGSYWATGHTNVSSADGGAYGAARVRLADTSSAVGMYGDALVNRAAIVAPRAISGGSSPAASVATALEDLDPDWAWYAGATCPAAGSTWSASAGGTTRNVPYQTGTWSCAGNTGGLQASAIGAARVSASMDPANAGGTAFANWRSAAGGTAFDKGDQLDLLYQYVGELGRPGLQTTLRTIGFRGDTATNNEMYTSLANTGALTFFYQTSGGDVTGSIATLVPEIPEYGVLHVLIRSQGAQAATSSGIVRACWNGTCAQAGLTGVGGAWGTGLWTVGAAYNGSLGNPFNQIGHSIWIGEKARSLAYRTLNRPTTEHPFDGFHNAVWSALQCGSPPCRALEQEIYLSPDAGEYGVSGTGSSIIDTPTAVTYDLWLRTRATPATNALLVGREPGCELRTAPASGTTLVAYCGGGAGRSCTSAAGVINTGSVWQRITMVMDEGLDPGSGTIAARNAARLHLYIDGVHQTWASCTTGSEAANLVFLADSGLGAFRIARSPDFPTSNEWTASDFANIALYRIGLTSTEISALTPSTDRSRSPAPQTALLGGWWKVSYADTTTTLQDWSGNNADITLTAIDATGDFDSATPPP